MSNIRYTATVLSDTVKDCRRQAEKTCAETWPKGGGGNIHKTHFSVVLYSLDPGITPTQHSENIPRTKQRNNDICHGWLGALDHVVQPYRGAGIALEECEVYQNTHTHTYTHAGTHTWPDTQKPTHHHAHTWPDTHKPTHHHAHTWPDTNPHITMHKKTQCYLFLRVAGIKLVKITQIYFKDT